jgi:nitrate reductase alpha subunit
MSTYVRYLDMLSVYSMPRGTMFMYHAQDKHIETPGSEITDTRGGSHNALL